MKTLKLFAVAIAVVLLASCLPPRDPSLGSASKLSVNIVNQYTPGAKAIISARPQVLKVFELHPWMLEAMRDYKAAYPNGKIVMRLYTLQEYSKEQDPAEAGRHFWNEVLWPKLKEVSEEDRKLIDYLEGPNEVDSIPVWDSVESVEWSTKFWMALSPLMHENGFKPCIASIPVGNPPGSPKKIAERILAFVPAIQQVVPWGGVWSYHAYTLKYCMDPKEEIWYSLRYRMFYDILKEHHPELANFPIILTEGGVDWKGEAGEDGWQARGTAGQYKEWLEWFDEEIRKDDYVMGVTLFQIGDTVMWDSFDCEPIADWLARHLLRAR